ncbi:hypothetical protein MNB_SM-4-1415 [hydrothermal vent metagenome]|uniref:Uncharacterized protein n=1 Tax=hydrothermal vent metagenome TaxID=652676 RepID=A0A1W1CRV0_9ZZZZ
MKKIFLLILLFTSLLMAKTYHFSEVRYSDALNKSIKLQGLISFESESLEILYEKSDKRLVYEDEELSMYEGEEEIDLNESEAMKIAQYFEIIILLYEGDEEKLKENFTSHKEQNKTLLKPKNEMKEYIKEIILVHESKALKSLKLCLSNDDTIKISIEDEVR